MQVTLPGRGSPAGGLFLGRVGGDLAAGPDGAAVRSGHGRSRDRQGRVDQRRPGPGCAPPGADWAAQPAPRESYRKHRPDVERVISQSASRGGQRLKLRYRGTTRNNAWLKNRTVSAGQLSATFGLPEAAPAAEGDTSAERVPLGPGAVATLHGALRQALHLGHNYIGTEHILLGLADEQDSTAATLAGLGLTKEALQQEITAGLAALQASRNPSGSGV